MHTQLEAWASILLTEVAAMWVALVLVRASRRVNLYWSLIYATGVTLWARLHTTPPLTYLRRYFVAPRHAYASASAPTAPTNWGIAYAPTA